MIFEIFFLLGLITGLLAGLILFLIIYSDDLKALEEFEDRQERYRRMI